MIVVQDCSESDIKVAVCVFMFDLLYLNGESLVKKPLSERRKLLHENFVVVDEQFQFATNLDTSTMEEVQDFLEESVKGDYNICSAFRNHIFFISVNYFLNM